MSDELTDADRVLLKGEAVARTPRSVEATAILVAGMHRSGTSALVRVLNLLGVDLPSTLYPARDDNPSGYWEPLQVVEAHEEFLAAIGSSFDDVFTLPEGALRGGAARELEDRLVQILESEFGESRQFVVKDPRLCRLVPIWIAALERFGASPRFVLPVRNPLEVAASLKIRNEYSTTRSLLLWLRHMLEAERHTRGFPRSVVSYEQLLRDWQGTVDKIGRDLGISWPRRSHTASAEIEQFLSPRSRHHSFDVDELRARADIVDWVKTTYELFAAAAGGYRLEEEVLDTLRDELDRADSAFGPLLAELDLDRRAQQEALTEQTAKLEEASAATETATNELGERTQALGEATAEIARLSADLSQREEAVTATSAEAATSRQQIEQLQAELTQQEQTLAEARADVPRLITELAQREQALAAASAEAAGSRQQVEQLQAELAQQEQTLAEARADVPRLITEHAEREQALAAASAEAAGSRQQVEQLQATLAQHEQALAAASADVQRLTTELARNQQELAEAQAGSQALEQRVQALVEESAARAADAQGALEEVTHLRNEAAARREQLVATRAAVAEGREQRKELSRELAARIEALSASEVETQRLQTESEALRAANVQLDSQIALLEAEKSGLGIALAEVKKEADRIREEKREKLAEAAIALAEADRIREESRQTLAEAAIALADREARLAKLQSRRFVRPRTKLRALSQFLSWLCRPPSGWRLVGEYVRIRRAGTFHADAYLAENPDVDASGLDPLMHYLEHGIREGRALAPVPEVAYEIPVGPSEPLPTAPEPVVAVMPRTDPAPPPGPVAPADYSDFIVLLSRQRSGTNPLRSVLATHPDVFCFNEVFNLPDRDSDEPLLRESNFFTFLERYAKDDIRRAAPDNHERLFLDYLEYLRCLSDKRYAVLDVKYNTTHFLARPWQERGAPFLLELIVKHGLYVLNVTRRNYLRYVLSSEKAWYSDRYTVTDEDAAYHDETRFVDPGFLLSELSLCREEDERIQRELTAEDRVLTYDYAEIFPGHGVAISPEFLDRFAAWRGVPNRFVLDSTYRKQSTLPLHETIENYEEIAEALRDGPFAYCLEDEPSYRPAKPAAAEAALRGSVGRVSYTESQRESWLDTIGSDPDAFVENLCRTRPGWISGSLSEDDARFLFQQGITRDVAEAVEIGTASGFSTAILAHAFHFRAAAGRAEADWRVRSYDILEHLYYDEQRRVGDAAREILPEELIAHVEFNAPAKAADVDDRHAADSIAFLFLDANHSHPWPALDLLATLPALQAGGLVLLHDINLPRIHPQFPSWGVTHVFEGLDVEKLVPDVELPNIGALIVPSDKEQLRDQLLAILDSHPWEVEVPEHVVERATRRPSVR